MGEKLVESLERKLDVIISLLKIENSEKIKELRIQINEDIPSKLVLEYADGTLSYTELKNKVANDGGVHEITVRRRIAELADMGLLIGSKRGREVYYSNTGIIEV